LKQKWDVTEPHHPYPTRNLGMVSSGIAVVFLCRDLNIDFIVPILAAASLADAVGVLETKEKRPAV